MNSNSIIVFLGLILIGLYLSRYYKGYYNQFITTNIPETNSNTDEFELEPQPSNLELYDTTPKFIVAEDQMLKHSNMNPHFGSKITQPMEKSVNLRNYTGGIDDSVYIKKTEKHNDITSDTIINEGQVDSGITREYYNTSKFLNSEKPFESELVGKGMGIDPDVPSSGGFHQDVRIIPPHWKCTNTNRDTYNSMNVVSTTSNTDKRVEYDNKLSNEKRSFMTRDVLQTSSTVTSHRLQENDNELLTKSLSSPNKRVGIISSNGVGTDNMWGTSVSLIKKQSRNDYENCNISGQPNLENSGNVVHSDNIQYKNNRDTTACDSAVFEKNIKGYGKIPTNVNNMTSRHMELQTDITNISGKNAPTLENVGDTLVQTNRETYTSDNNHKNISAIISSSNELEKHYELCPPITQRDKTNISNDCDNFKFSGPANSNDSAPMLNYNDILKDIDLISKRESTAINQQPGPQNINKREDDINKVIGLGTSSEILKSDQYTTISRLNLDNTHKEHPVNIAKQEYNVNRLEVENDRIVSDAISNKHVLSNNELHNPII